MMFYAVLSNLKFIRFIELLIDNQLIALDFRSQRIWLSF